MSGLIKSKIYPFIKAGMLLSGLLLASEAHGQIEITELDSIAIVKPKKNKDIYQFFQSGPKEIQYEDFSPELSKDPSTPKLNGFGSAAFTTLTGIGSSSRTEGYWKVSGKIHCNDTLPDWTVDLFCEGYREKTRERVKENDGSWSMESNVTNFYDWEKKSDGVIIQNIDTICSFNIIMNVNPDDLLSKWYAHIFQDKPQEEAVKSKNKWFSSFDLSIGKSYEITGKYLDKNFILIQNGSNRKVWIFLDDLLAGMFQGDVDYPGVNKKSRNIPYIFINKQIPEQNRRDIIRLAIASRFMNNYLSKF